MTAIYLEIGRNVGGDDEEWLEAFVEFSSRRTVKGCKPSWDDAGWPDEWEHTVTHIGFTKTRYQANPPTMTPAERAACMACFKARQSDCDDLAING
jgi:hypothetical protein